MSDMLLENCILSFANLFSPRAAEGSDRPRYGASLILPETFDWGRVYAAIDEAQTQKFGAKFAGNRTMKMPYIQVDDGPYQGRWAIRAYSSEDRQPALVDLHRQPIMDRSQLFSGCIVHASIRFYAYDNSGKGVTAGLNGVMLVRNEGVQRLDNSQTPEQMFAGVAGAPATPAPASTAPPAAPQHQQAAPPAGPQNGQAAPPSAPPQHTYAAPPQHTYAAPPQQPPGGQPLQPGEVPDYLR